MDKKEGRSMQLWEYVILAVALSILGVFAVIGLIIWFAMQGNLYAVAILAGIGVAVAILFGGILTWATMAVNQKQDERAANQQFKITQMMMQQQQLASGQQWTEQMKALADGFRMKQQQEKALQEQAKTQRVLAPVQSPYTEGEFLEIEDMDVQL